MTPMNNAVVIVGGWSGAGPTFGLLREAMERNGPVEAFEIIKAKYGGEELGYCAFRDPDSVNRALRNQDGVRAQGMGRFEVKRYFPRDDRVWCRYCVDSRCPPWVFFTHTTQECTRCSPPRRSESPRRRPRRSESPRRRPLSPLPPVVPCRFGAKCNKRDCPFLHPPANSGTPANNAVCITGITDHRLEERDLREIMERHGPVSSVVIKNHFTARFAFCEFHDASSVVRALRNLDGLPRAGDPHGRKWFSSVKRFAPKNDGKIWCQYCADKGRPPWEFYGHTTQNCGHQFKVVTTTTGTSPNSASTRSLPSFSDRRDDKDRERARGHEWNRSRSRDRDERPYYTAQRGGVRDSGSLSPRRRTHGSRDLRFPERSVAGEGTSGHELDRSRSQEQEGTPYNPVHRSWGSGSGSFSPKSRDDDDMSGNYIPRMHALEQITVSPIPRVAGPHTSTQRTPSDSPPRSSTLDSERIWLEQVVSYVKEAGQKIQAGSTCRSMLQLAQIGIDVRPPKDISIKLLDLLRKYAQEKRLTLVLMDGKTWSVQIEVEGDFALDTDRFQEVPKLERRGWGSLSLNQLQEAPQGLEPAKDRSAAVVSPCAAPAVASTGTALLENHFDSSNVSNHGILESDLQGAGTSLAVGTAHTIGSQRRSPPPPAPTVDSRALCKLLGVSSIALTPFGDARNFKKRVDFSRFPLLWLGSLRFPEDGETSHMPTVLASVRAVHVRGDDLELMLMVESCMHGREDLKLLCGGGRGDLWCSGKENVPRSLIICALLFADGVPQDTCLIHDKGGFFPVDLWGTDKGSVNAAIVTSESQEYMKLAPCVRRGETITLAVVGDESVLSLWDARSATRSRSWASRWTEIRTYRHSAAAAHSAATR